MRAPAAEVVALARELATATDATDTRPRVVDLGCGDGRHVVALAAADLDVVAVDSAPEAARALTRVAPGTNFVLHDLRRPLPLPPDAFDGCILWSVLPHAHGDVAGNGLRDIGRVLRPGATLLVNFLDPKDCRAGLELETSWGPLRFHRRDAIDPHLWWGRIADARLVREEIADLGRSAEWRLRVTKYPACG